MELERFHQIGGLLIKKYEEEKWPEAEQQALDYLESANKNISDWNYGNAIHLANLVLGKINLINDDLEQAKDYLLKAARTDGSPQLKSFGPNMSLARDLLEVGEKEVVLKYLDLVKKFWYPLFSFFKIRKWKKEIKNRLVPDFAANNIYHLRSTPTKRD